MSESKGTPSMNLSPESVKRWSVALFLMDLVTKYVLLSYVAVVYLFTSAIVGSLLAVTSTVFALFLYAVSFGASTAAALPDITMLAVVLSAGLGGAAGFAYGVHKKLFTASDWKVRSAKEYQAHYNEAAAKVQSV